MLRTLAESDSQGYSQLSPAINLDAPSPLAAHKAKALQAAVNSQHMPLGNMTGMTE